ncbi:LysR family transcriptional regulator [Caballeronia sordidicola]|uniref:LysR family transcriptional regulator n=1 Tax=Caballeronia sordidicola TaxID=196367 RepID=A0A158GPK7_CABSO|nr:LysR family transcriptional regulator [Caballeronia sordidicola]SAL33761.1 LysR family transcriptional regulator [Caballeronia sordidicola]
MNESGLSWDFYRTFLDVLREGSLSGAARSLGLTQPTVGRHVDALEEALGYALFIRTQQGLSPTQEALALRPYAQALESTSTALLRAASSQGAGVCGTIRITASEVITVEVLPAIVTELHAAYPELTIELMSSNRIEDLLQRDADIAVRMQRPSQGVLIARRMGDVELGMYARKDYLARRGRPLRIGELENHALIGFDKETAFIRGMKTQMPEWRRELLALRTDSDLASLAMLRAGFGIGICQVGLARRDPELVRLFPKRVSLKLDTWLAMHKDLRDNPSCKIAFAILAKGLEKYVRGA